MLKKRELQDCQALYELMVHPDVFPFVRHKAYSYEEFLFITKQARTRQLGGSRIKYRQHDERERESECHGLTPE